MKRSRSEKENVKGCSRKKEKVGCSSNKEKQQKKVSYLKRSEGLKKKLYELTTLCDIEGFMIIIPEATTLEEAGEPITWPENKEEVLHLIRRYSNAQHGNGKEHVSGKCLRKNEEISTDTLEGFSQEQLQELKNEIDSKIAAVDAQIEKMQRKALDEEERLWASMGIII